jgi:hypothetical protein
MRKRILLGLALLALVALVVAGCGGKSRNKAYSGSKADFAAAMDSICLSYKAKAQAIGSPNSIKELADKGPQLRDALKAAVDKLRSLEPPAEIKGPVDDFIKKTDQTLAKIDDLIKAAKDNDQAKVQQLGQEVNTLNKSNDADAVAIGASHCVSSA